MAIRLSFLINLFFLVSLWDSTISLGQERMRKRRNRSRFLFSLILHKAWQKFSKHPKDSSLLLRLSYFLLYDLSMHLCVMTTKIIMRVGTEYGKVAKEFQATRKTEQKEERPEFWMLKYVQKKNNVSFLTSFFGSSTALSQITSQQCEGNG